MSSSENDKINLNGNKNRDIKSSLIKGYKGNELESSKYSKDTEFIEALMMES